MSGGLSIKKHRFLKKYSYHIDLQIAQYMNLEKLFISFKAIQGKQQEVKVILNNVSNHREEVEDCLSDKVMATCTLCNLYGVIMHSESKYSVIYCFHSKTFSMKKEGILNWHIFIMLS